ncbi:hypothetical protein ECH_0748 [Ehrlichia chaffeensis str. Arkansas]|uniref:Uncharacterized protein n=1 Tax=Ehrlichia chaffeensis (strain ATCC CRL-10679 / Arkansas) TaxID=205920 RepID=Q2GG87_EHRCR|nr:hypothetical protein ECH_0748 [Ehrlichia chaffeensis str. Arkansas]
MSDTIIGYQNNMYCASINHVDSDTQCIIIH